MKIKIQNEYAEPRIVVVVLPTHCRPVPGCFYILKISLHYSDESENDSSE